MILSCVMWLWHIDPIAPLSLAFAESPSARLPTEINAGPLGPTLRSKVNGCYPMSLEASSQGKNLNY